MRPWRLILAAATATILGLATVRQHVERFRIGYELRQLEKQRAGLEEELTRKRVAWERAASVENLIQSSRRLGVAEGLDVTRLEEIAAASEAENGRRGAPGR